MHFTRLLALALLLSSLACGEKKKETATTEPVTAETAEKETTKADDPAAKPAADPAAEETTAKPSLPPYSGAPVSDEAAKKSRALNIEALTLHRAKKFDESAPLFVQSLESNPGNILARYNLACTYNLADKRKEALAALGQLKDAGCRACLSQVKGAPADKDFKSALEDADFVKMTTGFDIPSPKKKQLAKLVMKAFDKEDVSLIADLVHPSKATKFTYVLGLCDPEEQDCVETSKAYGLEQFTKEMKELTVVGDKEDDDLHFGVGDGVGKCGKKCCDYTIDGISHGTLWLSRVCYHDRAGTLFLTEIVATDES